MTLEVIQFRKKKDGGYSVQRLGLAEKNDKGALEVTLFAMPIPRDGLVRLTIQQKREPNDPAQQGPQGGGDMGEEIPF